MIDCTPITLLFHTLPAKVEAFFIIRISFSVRSSQNFYFFKSYRVCSFHFSIVFRFVYAKILLERGK